MGWFCRCYFPKCLFTTVWQHWILDFSSPTSYPEYALDLWKRSWDSALPAAALTPSWGCMAMPAGLAGVSVLPSAPAGVGRYPVWSAPTLAAPRGGCSANGTLTQLTCPSGTLCHRYLGMGQERDPAPGPPAELLVQQTHKPSNSLCVSALPGIILLVSQGFKLFLTFICQPSAVGEEQAHVGCSLLWSCCCTTPAPCAMGSWVLCLGMLTAKKILPPASASPF